MLLSVAPSCDVAASQLQLHPSDTRILPYEPCRTSVTRQPAQKDSPSIAAIFRSRHSAPGLSICHLFCRLALFTLSGSAVVLKFTPRPKLCFPPVLSKMPPLYKLCISYIVCHVACCYTRSGLARFLLRKQPKAIRSPPKVGRGNSHSSSICLWHIH